jgi:leucyl aminopeptidase
MGLKITVSAANPLQLSVDAVAIVVPKGAPRKGLLKDVLKAVGTTASRDMKRAEFTGKKAQVCEIGTGGKIKPGAVFLVGMGDADELTYSCLRRLAAKAARRANSAHYGKLGFVVPEGLVENAECAVAEGATLGAYRFEKFKTEDKKTKFPLEKVTVLTGAKVNKDLRDEVNRAQSLAEAVCIARDLINTPPNELYPESFANFCKELAKEHKANGLTCTVFSHKQIKDKGMNLLEAVGRGSARGPRLIHMKYVPAGYKRKPGQKRLKRLVFVGKGITFDTGGICLKPPAGMDEMKGDMGGAANVAALMAAVAVTQPQVEVHGLIASAENMPDGLSYRPGDIFTGYSGKTVEIINTDAEGRLALADALAYGVELEPDFMLDNATLTGAIVVALGPTVSAYYSNRDELSETMKRASETAGEAMWHMPLVDELREKLKSEWADCKHMGDRWGGSITAALFLEKFVGEVPWVHVDVAGPSMADKAYNIYTKGGTGHGVLTYLALIDELIAPEEPDAAGDEEE